MHGRPCAAGFHQSWMSFSVTNSRIAFQIRFRHFRHNRNTQNRIRADGRIDLSTAFVPINIPFIVAVAIFRLVLTRVWRDIRDSHNGGHCLLTVGGRLRRVKIGGECVKYAWLSCPARPSRWVLCISMQWLTLKGYHVPCDECASGEICSHQHMWVTGLSYGQSRVTKIWGPRCKRD